MFEGGIERGRKKGRVPWNVCLIYGNLSRPVWFTQDEKSLAIHFLLNKHWLCNILEYQWISGCWIRAPLSVTESAVTGIGHSRLTAHKGNSMALTAFDHNGCQINNAHAAHQLFALAPPTCCTVRFSSTQKKIKKKTHSKQFGWCRISPAVSGKDRNPSVRTIIDQHSKLLSLVSWNYFSLLTSVLAFHLVRKLNLRSSSLPVFTL